MKEGKKVYIEVALYKEFCQKYGVAKANTLIIFHEQCREHGDAWLRLWYPQRTYYYYRKVLVRDGYFALTRMSGKTGQGGAGTHTTCALKEPDENGNL